ncbi:hypothetical protein MTO96_034746 [Rhipicephalus appendiculatus]
MKCLVSLAALVFSSEVYDTELGEFLDWEEGTILTASSKIRAVQLEPPEPSTLPPPVTAEVVYPGKLYEEAARQLVFHHVVLKDSLGSGYMFHEFELLGGKPPMETLVDSAQKHIDTILNMMKRKMEPTTSQLLGMTEGTSEDDKKLLTTLVFLTALPRTVKEKSSAFLKDTAPWYSAQHSAIWDTVEFLAPCMVLAENQLFKSDNVVQAILLCFCLHWVLDICYEPDAKGFYSILAKLLGLDSTKLSATAIHVLSALKE